jgi:hypothetical protein
MARVKRVRWECPSGLHAGVLGPSRPRKNATARFCLPCSEAAGVLVERVAPAVERKRAAKSATAERRREAAREREREAKARACVVVTSDGAELDLRAELDAMMRGSETLRDWARDSWLAGARFRPELKVRRGAKRHVSGCCDDSADIVLTVGAGADRHEVREVLLHELAHAVSIPSLSRRSRSRKTAWHGSEYKSVLCRAARELFGTTVHADDARETYELDRLIAAQMRAKAVS